MVSMSSVDLYSIGVDCTEIPTLSSISLLYKAQFVSLGVLYVFVSMSIHFNLYIIHLTDASLETYRSTIYTDWLTDCAMLRKLVRNLDWKSLDLLPKVIQLMFFLLSLVSLLCHSRQWAFASVPMMRFIFPVSQWFTNFTISYVGNGSCAPCGKYTDAITSCSSSFRGRT